MAIRYLSGINVDSNTLFVNDANNLVGIGTGSPAGSLHIQKNSGNYSNEAIKITGTPLSNVTDGTSATEGYGLYLSYNISGNRQFVFADTVSGYGVRYIGTSLDGFNKITQSREDLNLGTETNGVHVAAGISNTQFSVSNVGGTASKIVTEIKGAASQTGNYLNISSSSGVGDIVSVLSSGNVGIGTTSPAAKLTVSGTTYLNLTSDYFGASTTVQISSGGGSNAVGILSNTFYLYPYSSNTTTSLVYGYNGNASWGLTNAGGNSRFDFYSYAAGSSIMSITSAGNVGIGTTSPTVTLEVSGRGLITSSGSSDTFAVTHSSGSGIGVNITKGGNGEGLYVNKTSGSGNAVTIVGTLNATTLVKSGGTSSQYLMADGSVSTLTNPVTGTGTTNYVPKWTSGSAIGNSAIYDNAGNVGIGTASPNAKLEVNGAITFSSVDTFGQLVVKAASGATGDMLNIGVDTANSVAFIQSVERGIDVIPLSLQRYGGNVGIGTTTPVSPLDVNGIISSRGIYIAQNSGTYNLIYNASNSVAMYLGGSADQGNYYDNNAHRFRNAGGGTTYAIITTAGNVGIGTTSPAQMLHVTGNGLFNGNLDVGQGVSTQDSAINVGAGRTGNGYAYIDLIGDTTYTDYALRIIRNNSGANALSQIIHRGTGDFSLSTNEAANLTFGTSASERMRITNAGNVGIGTTSPGTKLVIVGGDDAAGVGVLEIQTTGGTNLKIGGNSTYSWIQSHNSNPLYINQLGNNVILNSGGGNVGIGTTSPIYKLHVAGSTYVNGGTLFIDSEQFLRWGNSNQGIRGVNDTSLEFVSGGSERMRITAAGNVGIGTTSPSEKLHVYGNLKVDGQTFMTSGFSSYNTDGLFSASALWNGVITPSGVYRIRLGYLDQGGGQYWGRIGFVANTNWSLGTSQGGNSFSIGTGNGNNEFLIDNAGNVGIGLTSPNTKLHLFGSGDQAITIQSSTTASSASSFVKYIRATTGSARTWWTGVGIQGGTDDSLSFYDETAGAERMRISSAGALKLNAYGSGSNTGTATQRLAVDASGNVIEIPIGSGPVDGNGTANYITKWSDADTITNSVIYENGGNIGIGVTNADYPLTVGSINVGGAGANLGLVLNSVISTAIPSSSVKAIIGATNSGFGYAAGSLLIQPRTGVNAVTVFATEGTEKMRITHDGNVGIGATAPGYKLEVNGDAGGSPVNIARFTAGIAGGGTRGMNLYSDGAQFKLQVTDNVGNTGDWAFLNLNPDGGFVGVGNTSPSQKLHVTGNVRVTGAYYDSNNEAGTSGQVLTSTGSGTDWVTPATTTASSLYDLLPAARVAYNWTGQVVNDTWTTIFSKSDNILTTGTWMVKMYVNDFAVGGGHYQYVYSGIMTWEQGTVNQTGEAAFSEIYLHRMGHAANASVLYLRTAESGAAASNLGYFQIKGNYSNTSNQTIQFQFVKIF
jgi:hypothetical protein